MLRNWLPSTDEVSISDIVFQCRGVILCGAFITDFDSYIITNKIFSILLNFIDI